MIIGLTGKKGSGKSTVAGMLCEKYGYHLMSFATPIKDMLMAMGLTEDEIYSVELKEKTIERFGKSPREMLQLLGTEFGRNLIADDIWVRVLEEKIEPSDHIVIDDVRFRNEAEMIRGKGGKIIRIERIGQELGMIDSHISEAGIPDDLVDNVITNMSCYTSDLELSAFRVMEELKWNYSQFQT